MILAVDPGCIDSAHVLLDPKDLKPVEFGKADIWQAYAVAVTYCDNHRN